MRTFTLTVMDGAAVTVFENITQCIAADASGAFGIMADHEPAVAVLRYGLLRFCDADGVWRYAAMPGGVLRFERNRLSLMTVTCFIGDARDALVGRLAQEIARADSEARTSRSALNEIEHLIMRRLAVLGDSSPAWAGP